MPPAGESDAGLFALRLDTFRDALPRYAREAPVAKTGERNFLPFIPWLAARARVTTFPLADPRQAVGVNTLEDLRSMETYLRGARLTSGSSRSSSPPITRSGSLPRSWER